MSNLADRIGRLSAGQRSALLTQLVGMHAERPADVGGRDDRSSPVGPVPLLPAQRLLLDQLGARGVDPGTYNITSLMEAPGPLRADLAELALAHVVMRHDALRLRFTRLASGWRQEVVDTAESVPPRLVDVTGLSAGERSKAWRRAARELHASLDLGAGPVLRLAMSRSRSGEAARLLFVISHLVADGYSLGVLINDFWTVYQQLERGEVIRLPEPTTSFKKWAERLQAYAQAPECKEDGQYWHDFSWDRVTELPATAAALPATPAANRPGYPGALTSIKATLPANETSTLLKTLPPGTQLPEALLAGLVMALGRWAGGDALAVSLVRHGRAPLFPGIDLSRTAGWLTVHPTVLIDLAGATGLVAATTAVAEQLRHVPLDGITWEWMRYRMAPEERSQWASRLRQGHLTFDYQSGGHAFPAGLQPITDDADVELGAPHIWAGRSLLVGAQVMDGRLRVNFGFDQLAYSPDAVGSAAEDLMALLRAPG